MSTSVQAYLDVRLCYGAMEILLLLLLLLFRIPYINSDRQSMSINEREIC